MSHLNREAQNVSLHETPFYRELSNSAKKKISDNLVMTVMRPKNT